MKIDLPLPIVASNLMIEFADFYENYQASTETLQCPRCSASVPANPGVCGNCGENVYQCHKCRWVSRARPGRGDVVGLGYGNSRRRRPKVMPEEALRQPVFPTSPRDSVATSVLGPPAL